MTRTAVRMTVGAIMVLTALSWTPRPTAADSIWFYDFTRMMSLITLLIGLGIGGVMAVMWFWRLNGHREPIDKTGLKSYRVF